jgi:cell wall-associated NlpC family hydrolase
LLLAVLLALSPVLVVRSAHADPIADKKKQAEEIAAKLQSLQGQVEQAANDYESAQGKLADLDQQVKAQQAQVDQAKAEQDQAAKALSAYAVNAYMSGGENNSLPAVFDSSADEAGQRQGYTAAAMGNRQQLIDNLDAAQQDSKHQIDQLNSAKAEAQQVADHASSQRQQAEAATAQYQALENQVQGELKTLVDQKIAAERAAAERAAYEAAQRQAAQQRASIPASPPANHLTSQNRNTGGGGGGGSAPLVIPSNGALGSRAVAAAATRLGDPYVWGASGPNTFDCSGLMMWAYAQVGVSIPRVTYSQMSAGRRIPVSQVQPGDLIFYYGGSHVAMYVGGGTVIHAPHTGDVVRYASMYMSSITAIVRPY